MGQKRDGNNNADGMGMNRNYIIVGGFLLAIFGGVVGFIVGSESQRSAADSALAIASAADKEVAAAKTRFDEYRRESSATIEASTQRADEAQSRNEELSKEVEVLRSKSNSVTPQQTPVAPVAPSPEPKIEQAARSADKVVVRKARFYRDKGSFTGEPTIALTVRNNTGRPIKKVFFHGVSQTPGRTLPWVDDDFNYAPDGGMEAGEELSWSLTPGLLSAFSKVEIHDDATFTVTVRDVEFAK